MGGGRENWWVRVFSSWSNQNSISPNWGENRGRWIVVIKWLNYPPLKCWTGFFYFYFLPWYFLGHVIQFCGCFFHFVVVVVLLLFFFLKLFLRFNWTWIFFIWIFFLTSLGDCFFVVVVGYLLLLLLLILFIFFLFFYFLFLIRHHF